MSEYISTGAVVQTTPFNFRDIAESLAAEAFASSSSAAIVMVTMLADGKSPQVTPFSDRSAAADAAEAIASAPGPLAYLATFDRELVPGDERFFGNVFAFESVFQKLKDNLPLVIGVAIAAGAAVYFYNRYKKRSRSGAAPQTRRARVRRRARTARRRTTKKIRRIARRRRRG